VHPAGAALVDVVVGQRSLQPAVDMCPALGQSAPPALGVLRLVGSAAVADRIRWGIAATGGIARQFAGGLGQLPDAAIAAVGSRSIDRAAEFAAQVGASRAHGSYEDLAADDDVDVVYVASPHSRHEADTLLFLEAGRHVLCEKPLALNRAQAERMAAAARERGLFLMEAMWSRFLPAWRLVQETVAEGRIGEPLLVEADLGFRRQIDPAHRLFDRALGGGATLDLGVYPVSFASFLLGSPDAVAAQGHIGETGVDEQVAAVLHHDGGGLAVVKGAIRAWLGSTARVTGSDGWVRLPAMMHHPAHVDISSSDGTRERIEAPIEGEGLRFQAVEVHRCVREGLTQSPVMPLDETCAIAGTLDAIRAQIGMTYPGE
jgi:predicted dehydrogenase